MNRSLTFLLLAALSSPFWDISHPLWEVDDARYAEVPREMVAAGDWASPTLNELSYVEKPPLWYWLAAASYSIFGVSEAAARIPLALLAILGALGTAWLGSWLYSRDTGKTAAMALSSSGLYFFLSQYITPDMGLTVCLLWSTALILRTILHPSDARWAAPAAWVCAGLAFLSKGLIGLVFPVGWTILCLVLIPAWRAKAWPLLNPLGPALCLATVAPWLITMEDRHPGFLHVFFVEQHFQRFTTMKYNRPGPWYFFVLVLPLGLMPWTLHAARGMAAAYKEWRGGDPRGASLALWCLMIIAFFSISSSKLATYILPVIPHFCLLASRFLTLKTSGGQTAARLGLAGLLLGACALTAGRWRGEDLSAKEIAVEIAERRRPNDLIYSYGVYLHGLPFYTRSRVDRLINWVGELHYAKRDLRTAGRFGDDNAIRELPLKDRRVFVVLRTWEGSYFHSLAKKGSIRSYRQFGPWALAEF